MGLAAGIIRRETRGLITALVTLALVLQTLFAPLVAAEARQSAEIAAALGVICSMDGMSMDANGTAPAPMSHQCPDCCLAACLRLALDLPPVIAVATIAFTAPARPVAQPVFHLALAPVRDILPERPGQPRAPPLS